METLAIQMTRNVPRSDLESPFSSFASDCPDVLPLVLEVQQPVGDPDCLGWLRRRHIPCYYQNDASHLRFAPRDREIIELLHEEFGRWFVEIGPRG